MRILTLLLLLTPVILCAQSDYSRESKKLYNKGVKEYEAGNTDAALELFLQCVEEEPKHAEAYLNISLIQYGRKEMKKALSNAQKAYHNNKFESAIYTQLGKCYYHDQTYDSAAYFISKGIEMGADDEFAFIYAGKSYFEMDEFTKAEDYLNKAIEKNDKNPVAYNSRGKIFFNRGEYGKAQADFKKALELNPKSAGIYANLANTHLSNEEPEIAMEYINKGMDVANDEQKVQLILLLGNYYHHHGELDKAGEQFEKALEIDQKNPLVLNNQAALLLDQDKFESALEKCNQALEIDPEMMQAYYNRGIANEMLRNVEEACMDWEQAFILGSEKAEEFLNGPTCNE